MQVHLGNGALRGEWSSSVVCIGTFDGVHLGHQAVISRAVAVSRAAELPTMLVTFDRHPASILAPDRKPPSLATLSQNLAQFERLGVSLVLVLPFDHQFSQMSANDFLQQILVDSLRAERVVVGHDFAMGHGREGTAAWLADRIPTEVVEPYIVEGKRVSSTHVREEVLAGEVEAAGRSLGRPYAVGGVVVSGQRLGRQLGFPTANLARSTDQAVPKNGIYAGWMTCEQGRFMAATSVGTRPAVGGVSRTIEAYLLDYPGSSLYGQSVELSFTHRLRDEWNFPSLDALVAQIRTDVADVRQRLSGKT